MNMMPHISHHLFAAAVATEALASRRPVRAEERPAAARGVATVLPLELLTAEQESSARAARPLRTVVVTGT